MAADADPNGLGEWAWRVGAFVIGAFVMALGFAKYLYNINRVAEDANGKADVNAERLEAQGGKIAALQLFQATYEAYHEAIMDNFAQLHRRHDEILRRLGG